MDRPPFIYIAALRRTGSTLLSEMLTGWPRAFIFREPRLSTGRASFKSHDLATLQSERMNLRAVLETVSTASDGRDALRMFHRHVVDAFPDPTTQFGVKEIRHEGFEAYRHEFPEMRVIVTARDPRDIFLSLRDRRNAGIAGQWHGRFTPESVAEHLNHQFQMQLRMLDRARCLKIRYEDLCRGSAVAAAVLNFVESPLSAPGRIGSFNAANPRRRGEFEQHGERVTVLRVDRHLHEANVQDRCAADRVFELMPEYRRFWSYD